MRMTFEEIFHTDIHMLGKENVLRIEMEKSIEEL